MELIAREGYWLTQANLNENEQRGFWKRMFLAVSLSENDFTEWDNEQKSQWEAEHQEEDDELSAEEALDIITGNNYE